MARKCCVHTCNGDIREARAKGLPLHKFPKDADLRARWLASGGFHTDFKPTPGQLVCHRHFRNADYETHAKGHKFLLRRGTVPTVFNDYDNHPDPVNIYMKAIPYPQEELSGFYKSVIESEMQLNSENMGNPNIMMNDENSVNDENKKDENVSPDGKLKSVNKTGLTFQPGSKLEAKDFNEKWYSARVVETDWEEREVLIHFDKWSSRFDEWIPMDSCRLRSLQIQPNEQPWMLPSPETKPKEFLVGERVLATWADGRKYPAKVNAVLGNDKYDVLFDDGYAKVVKSSKMTKIAATSDKVQSSEEDAYIGSKQERRDKKRKHSVMELFSTHSRKKPKLELDGKVKKEPLDGSLGEAQANGALTSSENTPQKVRSHVKKRGREFLRTDTDYEDDPPEWVNGEPQGTEAYIVEGSDGPRRSIIVADKRLPEGWQKHFTQRRTGSSAGKWDVFFVHNSSGKKFRSRNEIKTYLELQGLGEMYEPERFDFCIHRKKKPQKPKLEGDVKKIKTLLPKTKSVPGTPETPPMQNLLPMPIVPADDNGTVYSVFIGGLRVEMEDSAYKCPKEGCNKNFRKENLLQMHIKHYHPEYSKFMGSTPNVADLAYARTIGESIDDIIPKKSSNFMDRLNKGEKRKSDKLPLLQPAMSPMANHSPMSSAPSPTPPTLEAEGDKQSFGMFRDEFKSDFLSDGHFGLKSESAISPGTAFDLRSKEERSQSGIKTLLPVRSGESKEKRLLDEQVFGDRSRDNHMHDTPDDFGLLDDSTLDTDKSSFSYRFSRKFDAKSDENSENSQLNDRFDKGETPKGESTKRDSNNDVEEEGVMMMINGEMVKLERLRREEIINCTCGLMEEDGLMIQCDVCLCWQHGHCNAIEREKDVPEKYICYICRYSYRQRPSKKYAHDYEWIKEGKLATLSTCVRDQHIVDQRRAMLKRSYDLVGALLQIQETLHSLRVKMNVAKKKDHPKLYLWAKNWEKLEIPKPDVEPVPVLEYAKPAVTVAETSEVSQSEETKLEPRTTKDANDVDGKSIASDTELMKILEEDSLQSNESKVNNKNEEGENKNILLDALTKSETPEANPVPDVKIENELSNHSMSMPNTPQPEEAVSQTIQSCAKVELDPTVPLQPFIPEPEAPIDPEECRLRLLEHIEHYQNHIDALLISIEAQVDVLEKMDPNHSEPDPEDKTTHLKTKQTVQMLIRDLTTVRKLAALC